MLKFSGPQTTTGANMLCLICHIIASDVSHNSTANFLTDLGGAYADSFASSRMRFALAESSRRRLLRARGPTRALAAVPRFINRDTGVFPCAVASFHAGFAHL